MVPVVREFLDEDYLLAVRREAEALDAQLVVGKLLSACTVSSCSRAVRRG